MAKPLRDISPKGQFSGKRSTTEAPPSIDKDNFYNWEGGEDGVKFIKKHQTSRRNYPYDADAAFTSGKVKQVDMTKHGYKKPADAKVYESKGMKCESCGKMYEGESCGCGKKVPEAGEGKKGMIADKKKLQEVLKMHEGAKVDRMEKHIESSEKAAGVPAKKAKEIAWATLNKRGYLNNKNKKMEEMTYPAVPMLEDGKKKKGKTQKESAPADTPMNLNTTGASFGITGDGRV